MGAGGSKHPRCIHEAGCHPCSACRRDPLCPHGLADMLSKMNTALEDPIHTPMSVVGCVGWVWDQQGKGKPVDLDTPLAKPPRHIWAHLKGTVEWSGAGRVATAPLVLTAPSPSGNTAPIPPLHPLQPNLPNGIHLYAKSPEKKR